MPKLPKRDLDLPQIPTPPLPRGPDRRAVLFLVPCEDLLCPHGDF